MLKLTPQESEIFSRLQSVCPSGTQLRVAGGWVRDKLLGLSSSDIDIAISNMTGQEFAKLLGGYHLIKANPEKSKHLETATVNIAGLSVDLVNLRSEVYSDSRIPEMSFGTPEEDASRRDLTINALFFNITDSSNMFLEDFVGGARDLESRTARTPIDPVKTFLDDPLRILRVIRFASRFNLEVLEQIYEAANLPEVKRAFEEKVSSERIWVELVGKSGKPGLINGPDPFYALNLICDLGLRDILFKADGLNSFDTDQNNKYHDLNIWQHTMLAFNHLTCRMEKASNPEVEAIRNLALILHDIGKRDPRCIQAREDGTLSYRGHDDIGAEIAKKVLDNLCCPIDVSKRICRLIEEHMRFLNPDSNRAFRRIIRDLGEDWENLLDICVSDAYGKSYRWDDVGLGMKFERYRDKINCLIGEQGSLVVKRPINGHDLAAAGIEKGPMMGRLMARLDEALLDNPAMSREEALSLCLEGK